MYFIPIYVYVAVVLVSLLVIVGGLGFILMSTKKPQDAKGTTQARQVNPSQFVPPPKKNKIFVEHFVCYMRAESCTEKKGKGKRQ